ncbi:uncharacterized protein LY89DRAFT_75184 [Mollisia scopiformis]|uniref:Uncharacterized protein n=1 Tax=Mollisia scopiformis TaxID=149040 RepID=A0A194X8K1_MOLSC|nr:uncharacterized protein LY89DRAFT_75184 [Mollisia scopiformis]KUJ16117.1 hypothetical protein LY89DRAFT_75184 [Mollisia scopiformis]
MKTLYIVFASVALSSPLLEKRYDLDHNGILDWCYTDGDVVSCLLSEASYVWTTFTATMSTQAIATPISTAASITTTPASFVVSTASPSLPTGTLPSPDAWAKDNSTRWHVSDVGSIYSSTLARLGWDNGRTSVLNNTPFWNFGDVLSLDGLQDGFSTGPAFYGTPDDILRVDMKNVTNVLDLLFCPPAASDPTPESPTPFWGLSTSNVAEVSPGLGIGFVWEIWRDTTGLTQDRGLGMYRATLGPELPIANRTGSLIAGLDALP